VLKTMHLFAGIGGGLLADLILGHNPVVAVDWDKYACRILRERASDGWFPGLSVWEGDVRLFDPSGYKSRVDIIAAGFPCQDISVAGKQAGLGEGTRSGLYREVLRIAGVVRPRYLFLENVSAILSNGLATVLGDLAALGYNARWLCIRASDVGAPHGRDRWFCLAELANTDVQYGEWRRESQQPSSQGRQARDKFSGICSAERVADTISTQRERGGDTITVQQKYSGTWRPDCYGFQRFTGKRTAESAMGCVADGVPTQLVPQWWAIEPNIDRVTNQKKDRVKMLRGLGNAQVPLQAAVAWQILADDF